MMEYSFIAFLKKPNKFREEEPELPSELSSPQYGKG
jgi:hypothetical protein